MKEEYPLLVSIMALILSVVSFLSSCTQQREKDLQQKRAELRDVLLKLDQAVIAAANGSSAGNEGGQGSAKENPNHANEPQGSGDNSEGEYVRTGVAPGSDFSILLYYEAAKELADEIPAHVTFSEYMLLADAANLSQSFEDTDAYAKKAAKALKSDSSTTDKSLAYGAIGALYMSRYPDLPIDDARDYFRTGQKVFDDVPKNKKNPTVEAHYYLNWALLEYDCGFVREGDILIDKAKSLAPFKNEPATHQNWLVEIDRQVNQAKATGHSRFPGSDTTSAASNTPASTN